MRLLLMKDTFSEKKFTTYLFAEELHKSSSLRQERPPLITLKVPA